MSCDIRLKEEGLKLTPQRRLILDIIHNTRGHLTGESIVIQVQTRMPGVNKSTIYRTLELLIKLDCVIKIKMDDKYIYHHTEEGHHHHLVCRKCGKTVACEENILKPAEKALKEKYHFQVDLKHLIINGLCRECAVRASL
jgi:Fur family ferric uptake transcriptional regulator